MDGPKAVARSGDVTATAGTTFFTGATSGSWTAGSVSETTHTKLSKALVSASCVFSFTGKNDAGAVVTGTETVTLKAGSTKLRAAVLRNGDEATGTFGNKLSASAAWKLHTGPGQ
ncbi:hypothetical protein JIG36_00340 [Actinoplanes sp. LDG1-06]|uniref:Uncharacterized protein n=1 Tax=Paractinoplanes ovalisporus TaxID=2810368 RepID=A0ABS2A400_9ACTN|nr:hypothetical protein [Actinoplanes ovalisporus]MBM2614003.1 hypothetical protein [Actinoplanes ovalisporus]